MFQMNINFLKTQDVFVALLCYEIIISTYTIIGKYIQENFHSTSKWQEKTEYEKNHWIWNNVAWLKLKETEPNMKFEKKEKTKYLFYFILIAPWKLHTPSSKMHKL